MWKDKAGGVQLKRKKGGDEHEFSFFGLVRDGENAEERKWEQTQMAVVCNNEHPHGVQ